MRRPVQAIAFASPATNLLRWLICFINLRQIKASFLHQSYIAQCRPSATLSQLALACSYCLSFCSFQMRFGLKILFSGSLLTCVPELFAGKSLSMSVFSSSDGIFLEP